MKRAWKWFKVTDGGGLYSPMAEVPYRAGKRWSGYESEIVACSAGWHYVLDNPDSIISWGDTDLRLFLIEIEEDNCSKPSCCGGKGYVEDTKTWTNKGIAHRIRVIKEIKVPKWIRALQGPCRICDGIKNHTTKLVPTAACPKEVADFIKNRECTTAKLYAVRPEWVEEYKRESTKRKGSSKKG